MKGRPLPLLVAACVLVLVVAFVALRWAERDDAIGAPVAAMRSGNGGSSGANRTAVTTLRDAGASVGRTGAGPATQGRSEIGPYLAERERGFRELVGAGRIDDNAMHEFIAGLSEADVRGLLPLVDEIAVGSDRSSLRVQLVERWAQLAPREAAAWCSALPDGDEKAVLVRTVADAWAAKDPELALQFGGPSREVFAELARRDPVAAATRARALPSIDDRIAALRSVANTWFQSDPGAVVRWLQQLPDSTEQAAALNEILPEMAQVDPALVADYLTHAPNPNALAELGGRLGTQWADANPEAASRWAAALPEGSELRRTAVAAVANAWRRRDRAAAGSWLNTLAPADRPDEGP